MRVRARLHGRCRTAARGATARGTVVAPGAEIPDVLASGIGMAGEDGYDLIRRVRRLPAERGGRLLALAVSVPSSIRHRI